MLSLTPRPLLRSSVTSCTRSLREGILGHFGPCVGRRSKLVSRVVFTTYTDLSESCFLLKTNLTARLSALDSSTKDLDSQIVLSDFVNTGLRFFPFIPTYILHGRRHPENNGAGIENMDLEEQAAGPRARWAVANLSQLDPEAVEAGEQALVFLSEHIARWLAP